jgi:hypothetical protein
MSTGAKAFQGLGEKMANQQHWNPSPRKMHMLKPSIDATLHHD